MFVFKLLPSGRERVVAMGRRDGAARVASLTTTKNEVGGFGVVAL